MKKLFSFLSVLSIFGSPAAQAEQTAAARSVLSFAQDVLGPQSVARLSDIQMDDYLSLVENYEEDEFDRDNISDDQWAAILSSEILYNTERGSWMDWKDSIYAITDRWGGDTSLVDKVFLAAGSTRLTDQELAYLHALGEQEGGENEAKSLFIPQLQALAERRDLRLLLIDTQADGQGLIAMSLPQAERWNGFKLGHISFYAEKAESPAGALWDALRN